DEAIHYLAPRAGGFYIDGTIGGGGHAERILEGSSPDGRLVGVDRDPAALDEARERLGRFGERVTLVHSTFGELPAVMQALAAPKAQGILVDLGVSSPQLDTAERGFSFAKEGPLDMRMDPTRGQTGAELLQHIGVDDLERILRDYGEERYAKRLARAIHDAARARAIDTTTDLAALIGKHVPRGRERIDPATRTFQ